MRTSRTPLDRGAALLGLFTVAAANVRYLAGLARVADPVLSMEPFYIELARHAPARILADPTCGPLYALWLKPFRALLGDPLAVYTANLYALSLLASLAIYCYALLLTRRAALATGAALFFLISDLNVPLSSKVCSFALIVIVAGLALAELVAAGARRAAVAAAAVAVASYVRPELYPAAWCLLGWSAWRAASEARGGERGAAWWPAGAFLLLLVAALAIGVPVLGGAESGDRLLNAFREHFAWNWGRWSGSPRSYLAVWQQEFGDARSLAEAFAHNPSAVFRHLADNLRGSARFLFVSAFDHYPLLAPLSFPRLVRGESLLVAAAAFAGLALVAARSPWRRALRERYGDALFSYAVLAVFPLASAVVVYAKPHYLLVPGALLILAAVLALSIIAAPPALPRRLHWLAAVLCVIAVPSPFALPSAYPASASAFGARLAVHRPVTEAVERIRTLALPAPVHVLTFSDGIGELLGDGFHELKVWRKAPDQPLEDYVRDNRVAVIVTLEKGRDSFLVDDPYWTALQIDPAQAGFTALDSPAADAARIWVRADLLSQRAPPPAAATPPAG